MSQADPRDKILGKVLVWDAPTRVFHWLLVLSFAAAYLTAESERYRDMHVVLGYTLMGLIAFRLLWGIVGTRYAQFRSFLFKRDEIAAYALALLKGRPAHYIGHNPLGSVSIWLLLGLGVMSGVSGLVLFEDIGGEVLEELHELASNAMLFIVCIHIAGVVASSILHRENLARAMVTGFKSAGPEQGIRHAYHWLGVIILAAVIGFWVGYPATGLMTGAAQATHAGQHDDDD